MAIKISIKRSTKEVNNSLDFGSSASQLGCSECPRRGRGRLAVLGSTEATGSATSVPSPLWGYSVFEVKGARASQEPRGVGLGDCWGVVGACVSKLGYLELINKGYKNRGLE